VSSLLASVQDQIDARCLTRDFLLDNRRDVGKNKSQALVSHLVLDVNPDMAKHIEVGRASVC
jgi:hypothetical protein